MVPHIQQGSEHRVHRTNFSVAALVAASMHPLKFTRGDPSASIPGVVGKAEGRFQKLRGAVFCLYNRANGA